MTMSKVSKHMFYVFTLDPIYELNLVVRGEQERDRLIASYKKAYPNIPVYWQEVREG